MKVANGCSGATTGAATFRFSSNLNSAGAVLDVTVTANVTVTVGASSPLTTTPSSIALSCTLSAGPTYTPGPAQTLAVKSATPGGTPFTVENSTYALPAWLLVTPLSGGTANATVTTVSATGGAYPYTYAITSPSPIPFGMSIGSSTGVIGVSALTPAGTYTVTVTATGAAGTPLSGSLTFDIKVALKVIASAPSAGTAGAASTIVSTVTTTGNTGSITFTLDATTVALGWVTINSSTGVVAVTTGAVAGTYPVTITATVASTATGASAAGTGTATFSMTINP